MSGIEMFEQGRRDDDVESALVTEAEREGDSSLASLYLACLRSLRSGTSEHALVAMSNVKDSLPGSSVDHIVGATLFDLGETDRGLLFLRRAVEAAPNVQHLLELARRLYGFTEDNERIAEAIGLYRRVLEMDESNPCALTDLGVLLIYSEQYEEAEVLLRRAATEYPDYPHARYGLGHILFLTGRYGEAMNQFWASLQLQHPEKDAAYVGLANCCVECADLVSRVSVCMANQGLRYVELALEVRPSEEAMLLSEDLRPLAEAREDLQIGSLREEYDRLATELSKAGIMGDLGDIAGDTTGIS